MATPMVSKCEIAFDGKPMGGTDLWGMNPELDEDLAASSPQERNWRGIIIALLVIGVMCSLIAAAILLFTPLTDADHAHVSLSLNDVINGVFIPPIDNLEWIDDRRLIIKLSDRNQIDVIDVSTEPFSQRTLVDQEALVRHGKPSSWTLSSDAKQIALAYDEQKVFIHENDLYYQDTAEGPVFRITNSSNPLVFNGAADWVYEEEILGSNRAHWWSRDGQLLAFLTINDTAVRPIQYPIYHNQQYPTISRIPYPKAEVSGLPTVSISIWNRANRQLKPMQFDVKDDSSVVYIFSASWMELHGQQTLVAVGSNRYQNVTTFMLCDFNSGNCSQVHEQRYREGDQRLWAEPEDVRVRVSTNDSFFVLLPHRRASGNVFTQVARVNIAENPTIGRVSFLPVDEYEVTTVNAYNEERNEIYFTAAAPLPSQRHLYVTSSTQANGTRCLTCEMPEACSFQEIAFANDNDHFLIYCRGPTTPRVWLSSISSNATLLTEFGNSSGVEANITKRAMPIVIEENVTLSNGYVSLVKMLLPPDHGHRPIDAGYPVVLSVYAGPGSQKISEQLSISYDTYMASNQGYAVIYIDGRGSGFRGWKYRAPIYGALGTVEIDDQIETMRILLANHRFLDRTRVAIWGWSYGGFVSASAIKRTGRDLFKCAVSVAPVTNFIYYDATYTERYMGQASEAAYLRTDLAHNVTRFRDVQFLLVHGTGDDNVHFQNTAELVRALVEQNIQFQMMAYTDSQHSLTYDRWHLFTMLTQFFVKCFQR